MPRVTLLASTLHKLLNPVLPHAATGQDTAPFNTIRMECRDNVLYVVGMDGQTIAVTRELIDPTPDGAVTIPRTAAAALQTVFVTSKLSDPKLTLDIEDTRLSIIADDGDGDRVQVHAAPPEPAFPAWRNPFGRLVHRPQQPGATAVLLQPELLARFAKVGKAHRLRVLLGPDAGSPLLVFAGDFFAAVWRPSQQLDIAREDWQEGIPDWREEFTDAHGQEVIDELFTPPADGDQAELDGDADGEEDGDRG
jgi:hypothetical protein